MRESKCHAVMLIIVSNRCIYAVVDTIDLKVSLAIVDLSLKGHSGVGHL